MAVLALPLFACGRPATIYTSGTPLPLPPARSAAVVIPTAEHYLGVRYRWGGTSPTSGFDCSGYVQYVFAKHGVKLPRTSRSQAYVGDRVALNTRVLQAGDLIMFAEYDRPISHVAIYAGNDRIIHSTSSGGGVRYDVLGSPRGAWFVEHAVVARRVGTAEQNRGIVRDLVSELRSSGVRVDFPLDLGDFAPRP